jgi:hypothetical protein
LKHCSIQELNADVSVAMLHADPPSNEGELRFEVPEAESVDKVAVSSEDIEIEKGVEKELEEAPKEQEIEAANGLDGEGIHCLSVHWCVEQQ